MEYILSIIGSNAIVVLITWFVSRRKSNAEAKQVEAAAESSELDNTEKAIKIWRELATDSTREINELRKEITALKIEINKLQESNKNICNNCEYKTASK